MSAPCVSCSSADSPEGARFCVRCGYARRQNCPYLDCNAGLDVRLERPSSVCGTCKRFLRVCPNCQRFAALGSAFCSTPRCARTGTMPVEPNPMFFGGRGPLGTCSVPLPTGESRSPTRWTWSEKSESLWGAAARYGRLVMAGGQRVGAAICTRHIPRPSSELRWNNTGGDLGGLGAPLPNIFDFVASPGALCVEGGFVWLCGEEGALRFDLGRTEFVVPQTLLLEDVASATAPGSADLDWSGWNEEAASPAPQSSAGHLAPDIDSLRWKLATATRSRWVALGESNGKAFLVCCDLDEAAFRAPVLSLEAMRDFPSPLSWRELMAWEDAVWLVSENEVWLSVGEPPGWRRVWGAPQISLRGAIRAGDEMWVWGESASGTSVWRFDAQGLSLGAPANFRIKNISCAPSLLDDQIVLAGQSLDGAGAPQVLFGRVALGEVARPSLPFEAGRRAVAVLGLRRGGQSAILLALESNGSVALRATTLGLVTQTSALGEPLPLADDGAASLAWCVCDDRLVVMWREAQGVARALELDLSRAAFWNSNP